MCKHASYREVLDAVSIEDACELNGIRIRPGDKGVICPFHEQRIGRPDRNYGNAFIRRGKNGYGIITCYACGGSGNAIDVTMAVQGMSFCEATDYLAAEKAPWLLKKNVILHKKDTFPFTDREMKLLGLGAKKPAYAPIGNADSVYTLKHIQDENSSSYDVLWYGVQIDKIVSEEADAVAMRQLPEMNIRILYADDPIGFAAIASSKAVEALNWYKRQKADGFPDEIREIAEEKREAAEHVLEFEAQAGNLCRKDNKWVLTLA